MSRLLIQLSHLFIAFESLSVFEDISISINEGERFALIGENGVGKTTLLQLFAGRISPDSCQVTKASGLTIGFLPQEVVVDDPQCTTREYLEAGVLAELEHTMARCLEDPERLAEWTELHEQYEHLGGYRKTPLEFIFRGLKLENNLLELPMSSLSSGQRVRIALAKALSENPDLLLLDEPTNHLDKEMVEWLEENLNKRKGACVIVSHDRKFLNATCNRLVEIKNGKLSYYGGGYTFFLDEQELMLKRKIEAYEAQQEEKSALKQKIKALTFSKARPAPCKDRNTMAYDKRGERHQKSVHRKLDELKVRLEEIERNPLKHPKPKTITGLRFCDTTPTSPIIITIEGASKSYGSKVLFSDLSRSMQRGERLLITGPNGCGKTTLLKCIAGLIPLDHGHIYRAPSVKIGFLDQEVELLPFEKTVSEYFENKFHLNEEALRSELKKAALGGEELLQRPMKTLSTGQRKRIMLLSLILEKPNVLLLDEPTNHLDLLTLEAFEKALLTFNGAIIAVSHDDTFIKKIAPSKMEIL